MYDYLLGGKDNYAADRQVVQQYLALDPQAPLVSRANRQFGMRAAQFIAEQGIDQFLDLGSGIPTSPPNVHDTVWAVRPSARVVYVDYDPIVVAHSAALRSTSRTTTILADIRQPQHVLEHPNLQQAIDLSKPVGVLMFSVLQGTDDPSAIVAQLALRLAPGSYLSISHMSARSEPAAMAQSQRLIDESGFPPMAFRTDEQVLAMFDGFDLVEPGLVDVRDWRPGQDYPPLRLTLVGGVGRKRGNSAIA